MVNFIIPSAGQGPKLKRRCPYCGRNNGNIHCAIHRRRISDTRIEIQRQLKLEGLEYAAKDMLELAAVLRQDPMPQKIPESIEKLLRRYINFIRLRRTSRRLLKIPSLEMGVVKHLSAVGGFLICDLTATYHKNRWLWGF